ncbi:hypothetical protein ANANG_G00296600, partial [Anguilla anguilla]
MIQHTYTNRLLLSSLLLLLLLLLLLTISHALLRRFMAVECMLWVRMSNGVSRSIDHRRGEQGVGVGLAQHHRRTKVAPEEATVPARLSRSGTGPGGGAAGVAAGTAVCPIGTAHRLGRGAAAPSTETLHETAGVAIGTADGGVAGDLLQLGALILAPRCMRERAGTFSSQGTERMPSS